MEENLIKSPRWINEILKPIPINEKVEITDEIKKEAEEFLKAVENGKIDEWFNKKDFIQKAIAKSNIHVNKSIKANHISIKNIIYLLQSFHFFTI